MARDTDRKKVSEAVRVQNTWRIDDHGDDYDGTGTPYVVLITDFNEQMQIDYNAADNIKGALYLHWDADTNEVVGREEIMRNKRERVLHLISMGTEN